MVKGKILRLYERNAVFESLGIINKYINNVNNNYTNYTIIIILIDTGSCLVATQLKEGGARDLKVCDRTQLPDLGLPSQSMSLEAIFGIFDLLSGSYVAVVVESEPFVSVSNSNINMRKVKKILVVPLFRSGRLLSESRQRDEDRYLQLLHLAFSEHVFFFSPTFDVTLTQQRLAQLSQRQLIDPIWARADHRFFWNREVILDLIACEADEWIIPFMSAYVEVRPEAVVDDQKFTLLFISRRSRYRQGCRFTRRGLDEYGYAANFVETEQILIHNDSKITSHVQIRGSIPIHWASPVTMKYEPKVFIDENRVKTNDSAEKHCNDLLGLYGDKDGKSGIIFINLIDNKKDQGKLGVAFKETIDEMKKRIDQHQHPLTYVWFDFHHETKQKGKYANLSKLVSQIDDKFQSQGFFNKLPNGTVTSWQVGVIRTNCMDNLDRTNVVQSLFARRSLIMQLGKLSILKEGLVLDTPWKPFEKIYKCVWANNADAISHMYAGTGALKTDFTRTGKRTKITGPMNDGINSCKRYYINNFTDGVKQDAIDLMLGNYHPSLNSSSPFTPRPGQESIASNLTKAFVLMMIVFSTLLLLSPRINILRHFSGEKQDFMDQLHINFLIAVSITLLLVMYITYVVVKKGSKIGENLVVHPMLLHEHIRNTI